MFPILESILFTSKLYLYSNFINGKGWNSDKKYVFGTENKSLSMEFMLTKLYNLQACILLVRPVWACPCVLRVLTLFDVLVLLKQVSGGVYVLSRQHAGEFTLSLLHLGSKLKIQTISAMELDHQNLAKFKFYHCSSFSFDAQSNHCLYIKKVNFKN